MTFFNSLIAAAADDWRDYCQHPFVEQLGQGTLSQDSFRHYLVQDYIFLKHFSRAWSLAVYKASTLEDMRSATTTLDALLNHEMTLHVAYGEKFGLSLDDMENASESTANLAYTRYTLDCALSGDELDLHVALAPCVIGYGEIGKRLAQNYADQLESNPYRDWIEMYSGDEYLSVVTDAIERLNRLAEIRSTEARFPQLVSIFSKATQLESAFWQMGLDISGLSDVLDAWRKNTRHCCLQLFPTESSDKVHRDRTFCLCFIS